MAGRPCRRMVYRLPSTGIHLRWQSKHQFAGRNGTFGALGRCANQLVVDDWRDELSSSSGGFRRSGPESGEQTLTGQGACFTRYKHFRASELGRLHFPLETVQKRDFHRKRNFTIEHVGALNPTILLRWLHSINEETAAIVTRQEGQPDDQAVEDSEKEVPKAPTGSLGILWDLPKLENPTTILINKVCAILAVHDWNLDTVKRLEDVGVVFTPFLIQQIVQRSSANAQVNWDFFCWAREKAGGKLSMRAHVALVDNLGHAREFELMSRAFSLILEDGHKSAWPFNQVLRWCSAPEDVEVALYFWNLMNHHQCKPTVLTYTRLIDLLARQGHHQKALEIFSLMLEANCPPNISTYNALIHAFGVAGQPEVATSLFDKLSELGCKPNYNTYRTLILLHVEAGRLDEALKYFHMLKAADMDVGDDICHALKIASTQEESDKTSKAHEAGLSVGDNYSDLSLPGAFVGRLLNPNKLVSLLEQGEHLSVEAKLEKIGPRIHARLVLSVLQRLKNPDTALAFFNWAKAQPYFKHNRHTYSMIIHICAKSGNHEVVDSIVKDLHSDGIAMNTPIFTALISCYGRTKSVEGALKLFEKMEAWGCKPDVVTYTSLIHLMAKHGSYELAVKMFELMLQAKITPNTHTYSVMIYNFVKAGKVTESLSLLKEMPKLGCQPTPITYATLIDYCAKEGHLDIAKELYAQMEMEQIKPLRATLSLLESALRKAGRIEDADKLMEKTRHRRIWDEKFKSSTKLVAQELLFKDLVKDQIDSQPSTFEAESGGWSDSLQGKYASKDTQEA